MSAFATNAARINQRCRVTFGTSVSYQPISGADPVSVSVILSSAVILENRSPGSYDHAFVVLADLAERPAKGDIITLNADTDEQEIYAVVVPEADAEGGASLTIRLIGRGLQDP